MRNLNYPLQQALLEDSSALLAARYDAVLERMLYPGSDNAAFTTAIHESLVEAECYYLTRTGPTRLKQDRDLAETMVLLGREEQDVRDSYGKLTQEEMDLHVTTTLVELFDESEADIQLSRIVDFGLLAARNKPEQERVETVLRRPTLDEGISDEVFRLLVKFLEKCMLKPPDEAAIEQSLNKLRGNLNVERRRDKSANTINRFYRSHLARQVLERLLDPATTRRDVVDEITVTLGKMDTPFPPPPSEEYEPPTVTLPWPILPPGQGERRPTIERLTTPPEERLSTERRLDSTRTQWIKTLAGRWVLGGKVTEVDLHNAGEDPNGYQAAILYGPDNREFAEVADTDIAVPYHGLFVAINKRLQNKQGKPVHWRVAFRGEKGKAHSLGVKRFNHTGQDFYARVMQYVCDAYREQFGNDPEIEDN